MKRKNYAELCASYSLGFDISFTRSQQSETKFFELFPLVLNLSCQKMRVFAVSGGMEAKGMRVKARR